MMVPPVVTKNSVIFFEIVMYFFPNCTAIDVLAKGCCIHNHLSVSDKCSCWKKNWLKCIESNLIRVVTIEPITESKSMGKISE